MTITHERLFEDYVLTMMCGGIDTQITEAYEDGEASARLIAAVALMAYTEFMGSVLLDHFQEGRAGEKFVSFLRRMGPQYAALQERVDVYDVFRCGLVHGLFVKGYCTIAMKNNAGVLKVSGEDYLKPATIGIDQVKNGAYVFIIEKYFQDFREACWGLYEERKDKAKSYDLPQHPRGSPPFPAQAVGYLSAKELSDSGIGSAHDE